MQAKTVSKLVLLGVGAGAAAFIYGRAKKRQRELNADDWMDLPEPDRRDPVQGFEQPSAFHVDPLDLDVELIEDAQIIIDDSDLDLDDPEGEEIETQRTRDVGDLYGMHTPPATDKDLARPEPEGYEHADEGENWLEALEETSAEGGPEPERESVADDEVYRAPHPTEFRDRPVADKGSGGRGGM
jgi:hypothetical protein